MSALLLEPEPEARTPLSRSRIVRAALRVVDDEGLGALTMRRLAAELDVAPMALYHHFPNKEALYDGIVEAVMGAIDVTADVSSASFDARLKYAARAYREVLAAHPNALPVVLDRPPRTPTSRRPVETMMRILVDGGLTPAYAFAGVNTIAGFVQSTVRVPSRDQKVACSSARQDVAQFPEVSPEEFPLLDEAIRTADLDTEGVFEFGLDAIVRGLAELGR